MDKVGYHSLKIVGVANDFNRWMYDTIAPFCHGNILEIGSGIGNISKFFFENGKTITLSDIDDFYVQELKKMFSKSDVLSINLVHENFRTEYAYLFNKFDTVFFLNVLEHISEDESAIENCKLLLRQGGAMVILVPAYSFLFSKMDKELNHYRRYTSKRLAALLAKKNLYVQKAFYFNAFGIIGWAYGKVFGLGSIPLGDMKLFNKLVPVARFTDKLLLKI